MTTYLGRGPGDALLLLFFGFSSGSSAEVQVELGPAVFNFNPRWWSLVHVTREDLLLTPLTWSLQPIRFIFSKPASSSEAVEAAAA